MKHLIINALIINKIITIIIAVMPVSSEFQKHIIVV